VNKPPAFQFYPKDFLSDINVVAMNMEERGIYITLLSICWLEGWLPNGSTKLQRLCSNPLNWNESWLNIKSCFCEKDGKLYHKRLQIEREKQLKWREKSMLGGKKSGEKRKKTKGGSTKRKPKGNTSSSSSSSSFASSSSLNNKETSRDVSPCPKSKHSDEDIRLVQLLIDLMAKNNPKSHILKNLTEKKQEAWLSACRLMREKDERTPEEIEAIIKFSQSDEFWKSNILSMPKLREKFDQLWLKAQKSNYSGIASWYFKQEKKYGKSEGF